MCFGLIVRAAAIPPIEHDAFFEASFSMALDSMISIYQKQDLSDCQRVLSGLEIASGTEVMGYAKASKGNSLCNNHSKCVTIFFHYGLSLWNHYYVLLFQFLDNFF